ncbi:DEAD/DEAH box helicase [Arcobacter sp. F2176]|uniref:DEAD/DEAH box helicase n=1 Tax=Arcobacter sp. F2176 TaxID=2044511 RepID=UPI00100BD21F|nr:DEAD/DEAH box helicase [Arcobacter sp. F2176]RXJ81222.1 RNA helicase [Arcobacter sp. F2176]
MLKALEEEGYEKPTEVQEKVIPVLLKNSDVIATAQSGTGKTAAFVLPILQKLFETKDNDSTNKRVLRSLILVPTRELAKQIEKSISHYGRYLDIKQTIVVGGLSHKEQIRKINAGIDVLVATPGRLLDHIKTKSVNLSSINNIVLDEADTMLEMGFLKDIELIFSQCAKTRHIGMFSATINQNIKKLAKEFLQKPVVIEVSSQRSSVDIIDQQIYLMDEDKKIEFLSYLIGSENWEQVLVFVNTKLKADEITKQFNLDGLKTACIHGDIKQPVRARALEGFKDKTLRVLVATDIAARGIDIELLPNVVNFELPETTVDYTHRIGRTGRAGNPGVATTLLCVKEYVQMAEIEKELIINVPRLTHDEYELNEKQPRVARFKTQSLSQKKGLRDNKNKKPKDKAQLPKKAAKKKKTTKRDANRSFGR